MIGSYAVLIILIAPYLLHIYGCLAGLVCISYIAAAYMVGIIFYMIFSNGIFNRLTVLKLRQIRK